MARILIVDDDRFTARLAAAKISQLGHVAAIAEDGPEALQQVADFRPDLILLDLMLPRMSGLEVCRALRADAATRDIPIVMLTGKVQERDVEAGFAAGANDYLTKPFSPRELQVRLQAHLKHAMRA